MMFERQALYGSGRKRPVLRQEITGTQGDDVLVGGNEDDQITGLDGNDRLIGNGGSDTLSGGRGDDLLEGGDGNDTLISGLGTNILIGGAGNDEYYVQGIGATVTEEAGGGVDTIFLEIDGYVLAGNVENLTLIGDIARNASGNDLNNIIIGNHFGNTLYGGGGNDYIDSGEGANNRLYGEDGDDTLVVTAMFNDGRDLLFGGNGNDVLDGGLYADTLTGGAGADRFVYSVDSFGFDIDNEIISDFSRAEGDLIDLRLIDANADTPEHDAWTFIGSSPTGAVGELWYVTRSYGILLLGFDGNEQFGIRLPGVTELFADDILGIGSLVLRGGEGDDTLVGGSAADLIIGNGGNDVIIGNGGNDTLRGSEGNDRLEGGDGDDTLASGNGIDELIGGSGDDEYYVTDGSTAGESTGGGFDRVFSRAQSFTLGSNFEDLTLLGSTALNGEGNALDNVITGNARDNILIGRAGRDTMDGGDGDDAIYGGDGFDTLFGRIGNDSLSGNDGRDLLWGGDGDDVLFGHDDNDNLIGEAGNDRLRGGAGDDLLTGGTGADRFIYDEGDFAGLGPNTAERIADFSRGQDDTIDFSAIDAIAGTPGDDSFAYIGAARFSGTAGELRFVQREGFCMVQGDTDGDGIADFAIRVDGMPEMLVGDFTL